MRTITFAELFDEWRAPAVKQKGVEWIPENDYGLYRIRDNDLVLYIGISIRSVDERLQEHLGMRYRRASGIGRLFLRARPESLDWQIDMFTIGEMRKRIDPRRWSVDRMTSRDVLEHVEVDMIQSDRPCLNFIYNLNPTPLPERYRLIGR